MFWYSQVNIFCFHICPFAQPGKSYCLIISFSFILELSNTSLKPRTISVTKTHIVLSRECHQWPLPRQYLPPTSLRKQFELIKLQKVIDITRLVSIDSLHIFLLLGFTVVEI